MQRNIYWTDEYAKIVIHTRERQNKGDPISGRLKGCTGKRNRNMPFRDEELCRQTRTERTMRQDLWVREALKSDRLFMRGFVIAV